MRYLPALLAILLPGGAFGDPVPVDCRPGAPTVCLAPDPDAPNVLVALTLPVGSADERAGEHGIAHYLEHLTFRNRAVEDGQMVATGAGIDGFGNAYTAPWATTYHWTVPPDRAGEAVRRAMTVLDPLDVQEVSAAQERQIVAREREEREDDPQVRSQRALDGLLYAGTPLARSVIGSAAEIAALSRDNAAAFHAAHYDPATAVLVLAGDVGWDAAGDLVGQGAAGPRRRPSLAPDPDEPQSHVRSDHVQLAERWRVALADHSGDGTAMAALRVLDAYLASSLPGAPEPALVRARDDVRAAWAQTYEVVPGLIAFETGLALRPGLAPRALDEPWAALTGLWSALVETGLQEETIARLRDRLLRDETLTREDGRGAAWSLIRWLESGRSLADWTAFPDSLAAVTARDVQRVLDALDTPIRAVALDTLPL